MPNFMKSPLPSDVQRHYIPELGFQSFPLLSYYYKILKRSLPQISSLQKLLSHNKSYLTFTKLELRIQKKKHRSTQNKFYKHIEDNEQLFRLYNVHLKFKEFLCSYSTLPLKNCLTDFPKVELTKAKYAIHECFLKQQVMDKTLLYLQVCPHLKDTSTFACIYGNRLGR